MRHFSFFVLAILCGLAISSCDFCDGVDCNPGMQFGRFRIVNATNGADLVFGPTSVYDKSQIKFYSLKGADTSFYNCETIGFPNVKYDSILSVAFYPGPDIAYMRLSDGDVDTFNIFYNTLKGGRCCPDVTEITKFRLNNSVDIPVNEGVQEIKK